MEDWEGVLRRRYSHMAEQVFPAVLQRRIIMNTLELAEDGDENAAKEARLMTESLGMTITQIRAGMLPPPPEPEKPAEPIMPLLGGGGAEGGIPSSAQKASALQRTPAPMVGSKEG